MHSPTVDLRQPARAPWQAAVGGALAPKGADERTRSVYSDLSAPPVEDTPLDASPAVPRKTWWSRTLRVVRDVAIGFALIAAIPLTVIGIAGVTPLYRLDAWRERIVEVERLRALRTPIDASVTPSVAGAALNRLMPVDGTASVPTHAVAAAEVPWRAAPLPAGLFTNLRSNRWAGPEASKVITTVARGVSPDERAWLATIAAAPQWQDADLVARAGMIDITGNRYVLPFASDAWSVGLPRFSRSAEFAHAGVARAAYYVAIGDVARAEAALRTVVSLGFALLDNSLIGIDGIIGRAMIDIGRDGMRQLDIARNRHDRDALTAPLPRRKYTGPALKPGRGDLDALRETAVADLGNASLPLSFRGEQLSMLAWSGCGSVRSVVLGPGAQEAEALSAARTTLARNDSERQLVDLMVRSPNILPARPVADHALLELVQGAANVTSAITGNTRIASCTRAIIGNTFGR